MWGLTIPQNLQLSFGDEQSTQQAHGSSLSTTYNNVMTVGELTTPQHAGHPPSSTDTLTKPEPD